MLNSYLYSTLAYCVRRAAGLVVAQCSTEGIFGAYKVFKQLYEDAEAEKQTIDQRPAA
jgi:hypothetical protein